MTRVCYWDSCIFMSWLKDERRLPGEMEGIREHIESLKKEEIRIMTSALTLTEVRRGRIDDEKMGIFGRVLMRRNLGVIDVDRRIAKLAGELKDYYGARGGKTLSTPDSIHLATAIIYEADVFHTFDASNKKHLGLLPLNGNVAGYELEICKPPVGAQAEMDFGRPQ